MVTLTAMFFWLNGVHRIKVSVTENWRVASPISNRLASLVTIILDTPVNIVLRMSRFLLGWKHCVQKTRYLHFRSMIMCV